MSRRKKSRELRFKTIRDKDYPDGLFLTEEVRNEYLDYLKKCIDKSKNSQDTLDRGPEPIRYHTLAKWCYLNVKEAKKINDKYFITFITWLDFNDLECRFCYL